ncbi:MAG TPA: PPOX class F420-dependent oxidoreductase [Acidimicrobiales bacterium]|nr:PPOX class F420-dependent oxidoreductase [Acidimicrobiales bacterium]
MELAEAIAFARARSEGVLTTLRRDGRPQLSNIVYRLDGDDIRISVTDQRAKTRNLRRDPRGSLYVPGDSFWAYVVLDGTVELSDVARDPHDAVVDELVTLYRDVRGEEHPDWDEYRRAMVADGRVVARLHPTHAYGMIGR